MRKENPVAGATAPVRKFWWLVSGDVQFHMGNPEEVQAASLNAIMSTDGPAINSAALGRAQAGLSQRLHETNPELKFNVVNVRFDSISGLGHMTEEEFMGPKLASKA